MILTVTLNAAIDKRYVIKALQPGEVNRISECTYTPGGKGLNAARTAQIYGETVMATGIVGGFAGKYIESEARKAGIPSVFTSVPGESRSCINIWDEETRQQTELLEPGLTVSSDGWQAFLKNFHHLLEGADVVTLSGSVPAGVADTAYQELVKAAKAAGKPVVLDTSGRLLEKGIAAKPTVIKPNIDEIRMLTGKECSEVREVAEAAAGLQKGGIDLVVVSLGAEGSVFACAEGVFMAQVPRIKATNTVGCGDAMTAGIAIGLLQKLSPQETLRQASAIASAAAMSEETGVFRREDMQSIAEQVGIRKIY